MLLLLLLLLLLLSSELLLPLCYKVTTIPIVPCPGFSPQLSRPDKKGEEEKTFLNLNRPGISFYFGPNNNSNNNFELVRIRQRRLSVFLVCLCVCVCVRARAVYVSRVYISGGSVVVVVVVSFLGGRDSTFEQQQIISLFIYLFIYRRITKPHTKMALFDLFSWFHRTNEGGWGEDECRCSSVCCWLLLKIVSRRRKQRKNNNNIWWDDCFLGGPGLLGSWGFVSLRVAVLSLLIWFVHCFGHWFHIRLLSSLYLPIFDNTCGCSIVMTWRTNINYILRKNPNSIGRLFLPWANELTPTIGFGWLVGLFGWLVETTVRFVIDRRWNLRIHIADVEDSRKFSWVAGSGSRWLFSDQVINGRERDFWAWAAADGMTLDRPGVKLDSARSKKRSISSSVGSIPPPPSHFYIFFFLLGFWKELLLFFFPFLVLADVLLACEIWKKKKKWGVCVCVCVSRLEVERGGSSHRSGRLFFFYPVVRSCVSGFLDGKGESSFPSLHATPPPPSFFFPLLLLLPFSYLIILVTDALIGL